MRWALYGFIVEANIQGASTAPKTQMTYLSSGHSKLTVTVRKSSPVKPQHVLQF